MSRSLASILEALELVQPLIVTKPYLADLIEGTGSRLEPEEAAGRLVREGWLAPLRTRGSWEFVPAARGGRYRSGDPFIELRAHLGRRPGVPVAVAFDSALWLHGFMRHEPGTPVFARRRGWRPPRSLDHMRSIAYEWVCPAIEVHGLPVWAPPTIVVAVADRPEAQGDWSNAEVWLPEAIRASTSADILVEAEGRNTATLIRLGHLAEWAGGNDVADEIEGRLPKRLPVTYLGPRRPRGRWVNRWRLYDSLLPVGGPDLVDRPTAAHTGPAADVLRARARELPEILARFGVRDPRICGSVARGTDTQDSDVDLLVDLPRPSYVLLAQIREAVSEVLGIEVDVFTESLLREDVRERVLADAVPL